MKQVSTEQKHWFTVNGKNVFFKKDKNQTRQSTAKMLKQVRNQDVRVI